jgi:hypothetical protein
MGPFTRLTTPMPMLSPSGTQIQMVMSMTVKTVSIFATRTPSL